VALVAVALRGLTAIMLGAMMISGVLLDTEALRLLRFGSDHRLEEVARST
jgi:hypothetical protein